MAVPPGPDGDGGLLVLCEGRGAGCRAGGSGAARVKGRSGRRARLRGPASPGSPPTAAGASGPPRSPRAAPHGQLWLFSSAWHQPQPGSSWPAFSWLPFPEGEGKEAESGEAPGSHQVLLVS